MKWVAIVATALGVAAFAPAQVAPMINEFVADHTGSDTHEYLELFASPSTDLSSLTILQIEGDGSAAGVIDSEIVAGTTDGSGFWVTPFLSNEFENGTKTFFLVAGFSSSKGTDLDVDNDGVFDFTPWTAVIDAIGVNDGGASDWNYGALTLNRDFDGGTFTVGGASRLPNGTNTGSVSDWTRNDFDGLGLPGFTGSADPFEALNTPGSTNSPVPEPASMLALAAGASALLARRRSRR